METILSYAYDQLHHCNTIPQHIVTASNSSIVYQCMNSSKYISIDRVGDTLRDCDYNDDEQQEVINKVCSNHKSGKFFNCTTKCINRKMVGDSYGDSGRNEHGMCDDEHSLEHYTITHVSFPSICNGFTELLPVNTSSERYDTDETECEL
jgi:hypothetical protein